MHHSAFVEETGREPHHYSGRTSCWQMSVHEQRQPKDIDTPFTFSMEGNNSPTAPRQQIPFAWAPGWNSPQAWNKFKRSGWQLTLAIPVCA